MGYNQENYKRIREEYRTKYLRAYEEANRRMAEVHAKSPEIAAIDRELSMAGAEIALAVIGTGEGYKEKLAAAEQKNLALQKKRGDLLKKLGYPTDYTMPPYECPKCKDFGFVDTKMCDCMRRELVMAAYESSGLGELMRTQSFASFDLCFYSAENGDRSRMQYNLDFLKRYAEDFDMQSDNLLFFGATGLGKTHLSTSIARRVIERGYDVYYTSAIGMFSDFEHARFGSGAERAAAEPTRYIDCDLLILDDLGTEVINQFTTSCLYMILNNRINLKRPTIINTNLTGKELQAKYADRIASRLFGEFKPLQFVGVDVRRRKLMSK
ncbi:MAG: ATP-binding protein [Clostridia bacterium]|nr:ATP-binding protein [Clostridia bacterium]